MMEYVKLRRKITFGLIFIVIGLFILFNDTILIKREEAFSTMNLELTELLSNDQEEIPQEESLPEGVVDPTIEEEVVSNHDNGNYERYAGILEIPKIGFNKGFYRKESSLNNVKFNLKILDVSSYPDEDKGNVIIIGHSGNYNNSYFANLYQLHLEDTASISYNGKKYTYKIVNIYTDTKDGTVTIYRNENKSTLTLITCTKDDDKTQTLYILELINVE